MRLGVITDVHISPANTPPVGWHNPYHLADAGNRFAKALQFCATADVDAIAVLGDLAHFGDMPSLRSGIATSAASTRPIFFVPGNHDVTKRATMLAEAIADANTANVQLASISGTMIGPVRVAGLPTVHGTTWWSTHAGMAPDVSTWGADLVVWLTHFPMRSLADLAQHAELKYPGDLENLPEVAAPILQRVAPTLVLHGHAHMRAVISDGAVLQLGCAALIEPPFDVTVIDIIPEALQWRVHLESTPIVSVPAVPLPLLAPALSTWRFSGVSWVPVS